MNKIKLGLVIDSFNLPSWKYDLIKRVVDLDHSEITRVFLHQDPNRESKTSNFLIEWFDQYETRKYKKGTSALVTKSVESILKNIVVKNPWQSISNFSDVDLIVNLIDDLAPNNAIDCVRFGMWTATVGSTRSRAAAGLPELLKRRPLTESKLVVQQNHITSGKVIYSSNSQTDQFSFKLTGNRALWKLPAMLERKLKELRNDPAVFRLWIENNKVHDDQENPLTSFDGYLLIIRHLVKLLILKIEKTFFVQQWILLFNISDKHSNSFGDYQKILPPKDRLWADPFIVYKNEKYHVFFEEALIDSGKGHISHMVIDQNGNYDQPTVILSKNYHLSYPFLFEWDNQLFMVPETSENYTVEVYKCIKFPNKWKFYGSLIKNIQAYDSTIIQFNNKWWLFANVKEHKDASSSDELHLYYADSPLSEIWTPHLRNPIISDVTKSRPAGKLFKKDGKLYRPSQNSVKRYGYGLKINQVTKLDEYQYEEIETDQFYPNWDKGIIGLHTINREVDLTIIDGIARRFRHSL